jgi:hypothetical protein
MFKRTNLRVMFSTIFTRTIMAALETKILTDVFSGSTDRTGKKQ